MLSAKVVRLAACGLAVWSVLCGVGIGDGVLGPASAGAAIRYVHAGLATGGNSGTTWADAYRGRDALTRALAAAVAGDEIWVVAGTYTPVLPAAQGGTGSRTTAFVLKNNVGIYGGFAGGETERAQRNPALNVTILSGDINQNDAAYPSTTNWTENSHHLITAGYLAGSSVNSTAVLDGFTLRNAFANGSQAAAHDRGGGLLIIAGSSPTLRNLIVINNRVTFGGGGMYLNTSSPRLEDCRFESNSGGAFGGACDMATSCNPVWIRCTILSNTAGRAGGVEAFDSSSPQFINCLFARNTATGTNGGGAMFVQASNVTMRNCTVVFNTVTGGGPGAAVAGSSVNLTNSIVAFNTGAAQFNVVPSQSYTCIPAGRTDAGNINLTPVFVNSAGNNFRLAAGSPGIDRGNNGALTADMAVDLDGQTRRVDDPTVADAGAGAAPLVDMGAFEYVPPPPACAAEFNDDGDLNADDLADYINCFFAVPTCPQGEFNGDGDLNADDLADYINAFFAGC